MTNLNTVKVSYGQYCQYDQWFVFSVHNTTVLRDNETARVRILRLYTLGRSENLDFK